LAWTTVRKSVALTADGRADYLVDESVVPSGGWLDTKTAVRTAPQWAGWTAAYLASTMVTGLENWKAERKAGLTGCSTAASKDFPRVESSVVSWERKMVVNSAVSRESSKAASTVHSLVALREVPSAACSAVQMERSMVE
jgi:hypothetical protein